MSINKKIFIYCNRQSSCKVEIKILFIKKKKMKYFSQFEIKFLLF